LREITHNLSDTFSRFVESYRSIFRNPAGGRDPLLLVDDKAGGIPRLFTKHYP
jgi:hypothetical protein